MPVALLVLIAVALSACGGESPGAGEADARAAAAPLRAYSIDPAHISVSGLSSGGYMAVQLDIAFSSSLRGAGVIAAGPYGCAQGSLATALGPCMSGVGSTDLPRLIALTDRAAASGAIDATANLSRQKIWLFSGTLDSAVRQSVVDDLAAYYRHYLGAANLLYKNDLPAEHSMPTDRPGNPCRARIDPYIDDCGYDAAGQLLQFIHGPLRPRNDGAPAGSLIRYDQRAFLPFATSHGLGETGFAYVPARCASGQRCKLHVALHGCKQYPEYSYFDGVSWVRFGATFATRAGYNRWADSNDFVVLYPQAFPTAANPNGCWDWWGYDDARYATRRGRQMAAIKAMIDRAAGN